MSLGIDVGTSAVKAMLVEQTGALLATFRGKTFAPVHFPKIKKIALQPGSGCRKLLAPVIGRLAAAPYVKLVARSGGCL